MSRKILITIVAAIAIMALAFGLSAFAASCGDDDSPPAGRVAQMRGADQGGVQGCLGAGQSCGSAACDGACDGDCAGDSDCDGSCDGDCAGDSDCGECSEAGPYGDAFGDEPICF